MAQTKEKKGFNATAYAIISCVLVGAILVGLTIFAFTSRYTAFAPEKVAKFYTDTIVQTGDGYNAYKNTLVSKNMKYGDFIKNAYMAPYVNDEVEQAEFVGTGKAEEIEAVDKVYSTMYDYYVELINTYGYDDYDSVFDKYFSKLREVRKTVFGDDYMDTEFMFGVFESNVDTYGKSLTGTEKKLAQDNETVIQEETTGIYQTMFGKDYKFTCTVKECNELSADEVKAYVEDYALRIKPVAESGEAKADSFGLVDEEKNTPKSDMISAYEKLDNSDVITNVAKAVVDVTLEDGTVVATQELFVVEIGNSWYVDNTNINTSGLYLSK